MNKIRGFEFVSHVSADSEKRKLYCKDPKLPKRSTKHSAGYDIFNNTSKDILILPGVSEVIPSGIKAYMMGDEVLKIYVRSSLGFKKDTVLVNSTGIIDSDYYGNIDNEGEIFFKFRNNGKQPVEIRVGDAMAQGIFTKFLIADNDDTETTRTGGIGSTSK